MPAFNALLTTLSLALLAAAGPTHVQRAAFTLQNGLDAQALNAKFASLTASSPCTAGESACVNGGFAQCVNGQFETTPCAGGLTCVALPLVNSPGTRYVGLHQCKLSTHTNHASPASLAIPSLMQTPVLLTLELPVVSAAALSKREPLRVHFIFCASNHLVKQSPNCSSGVRCKSEQAL